MNELFFLGLVVFLAFSAKIALRFGKEALITFTILQAILANLFVVKQMTLFHLTATCGDAFAVSALLGLNWIQREYGVSLARKTTTISFALMIFFVAVAAVHTAFIPSPGDTSQAAFERILSPSPRILASSIAAFFIVQRFDLWFLSWLNRSWTKAPWGVKSITSLLISQLLDTILFTSMALWGVVPALGEIMIVAFTIKAITVITLVSSRLLWPQKAKSLS